MTKHSHFPYTSTYSFTYYSTHNTYYSTHNIYHIPYRNILQHSKANIIIFNKARNTTYISTGPHTVTTNMRHIHTSIVSGNLATRGNNKILHPPPSYISSSEDILHRVTLCTLAQLRTINHPFSKHTYTN